jgi:hypothetical protein
LRRSGARRATRKLLDDMLSARKNRDARGATIGIQLRKVAAIAVDKGASKSLADIYLRQVRQDRRHKMNDIMRERLEIGWQVIGMVAVLAAIGLAIAGILVPKKLNRYYLYQDSNNGMAACVYTDWEWGLDSKCYCSNNPAQAIEEVQKLNEGIR